MLDIKPGSRVELKYKDEYEVAVIVVLDNRLHALDCHNNPMGPGVEKGKPPTEEKLWGKKWKWRVL